MVYLTSAEGNADRKEVSDLWVIAGTRLRPGLDVCSPRDGIPGAFFFVGRGLFDC